MFDIVDLGGFVQDELRQSIEREGKIIYEKIWKLSACTQKLRGNQEVQGALWDDCTDGAGGAVWDMLWAELESNERDSRNNVSHAYNEGIAAKIVSETKAKYIDMFEALEEKVKSNWISE